ncbi:MAG: glycosyltransferase family 4 protein, partial [Pseudomonadota bacterium]
LLIDGLALGAMPAKLLRSLDKTLIALHHHPLGLEPGLSHETARARLSAEAEALAACAAIVTTSATTAETLTTQLGVPKAKITIAEPGVSRRPPAPRRGDPPRILGVGTISRRKGWDLLIPALAPLAGLPWQLEIAGAQDRESNETKALRAAIEAHDLSDRIALPGPLSEAELAARYAAADLFVLPSRYEGYGMVVAEAMAHALPVLTTTAGALPEVAGGAARLVPPDDVPALSAALAELLTSPAERDRLAEASRKRAETLPSWHDAAAKLANLLRGLS